MLSFPGHRISKRSSNSQQIWVPTSSPTVPTNSVVDKMDVDMTDPSSIWDYCIHGLEHHIPDDNDPNLRMFVNAVTEIASNLNWFDKSKYPTFITFMWERRSEEEYELIYQSWIWSIIDN